MLEMDINYNKTMPEAEFRRKILATAKHYGCDIEVRQIFNRYDKLLASTQDPISRKQISIMGIAEIHKIMDCYGALVIDGKEIIPADKDFNPNNLKK